MREDEAGRGQMEKSACGMMVKCHGLCLRLVCPLPATAGLARRRRATEQVRSSWSKIFCARSGVDRAESNHEAHATGAGPMASVPCPCEAREWVGRMPSCRGGLGRHGESDVDVKNQHMRS